jgi:hypothetical protein
LGASWWALAELDARYIPRPYEFEVAPFGVVGRTPRLWLAATVGAMFEIH